MKIAPPPESIFKLDPLRGESSVAKKEFLEFTQILRNSGIGSMGK